MRPTDMDVIIRRHKQEFVYDGDNSVFVVWHLLPFLHLSERDKQVVRWAYGYDGESKNYEIESDGETFVKDWVLGGKIKSPQGVTHDYTNRVPDHQTPDGHVWTRPESNNLYYRISAATGYPWLLRSCRWLFVTVWPFWWK